MTAAHIIIMILFAIAMMYYTIKWRKRKNDSTVSENLTEPKVTEAQGHAPVQVTEAAEAQGHAPLQATEMEKAHERAAVVEEAANGKKADEELSGPQDIVNHYRSYFQSEAQIALEQQTGDSEHSILQFPPAGKRGFWVSATCGLSQPGGVELILYSSDREAGLPLHLANVANQVHEHFEKTGRVLQPGDALTLQNPIVPGSRLTCLYVSQPLFEEESFSHFTDGVRVVRFLMLHAISSAEFDYLRTNGAEALEALFVEEQVNSIDFFRKSAVAAESILHKKE